jgi:hypothetical protein
MLPPGLRSQQAGTILPTLMPIPPAMPPRLGSTDGRALEETDQRLGFMCSARLRNRLGSHEFHWFQS